MTRLIIFKLILLVNLAFGQTAKTDSIDYSTFLSNKSYWLVKVKTKNSKEAVYDHQVVFFTQLIKKPEDIEPKWATTINVGDTVMWADWDYDKGDKPIGTHSCGKITLNKLTDQITLEKYIWGQKKTFIRKFKVLRWTKEKIVLLDLSNIKLRRIYSFE